MPAKWEWRPLGEDTWDDLVRLFGPQGACAGCWCMFWRAPRAVYREEAGAGLKRRLHGIVASGAPTGVIGYRDGVPVAWCSVAPREQHAALQKSPKLKPIDDAPVWSVTCFYIAKEARRSGAMAKALRAAVDYARSQGARVVEGYPTPIPKGRKLVMSEGYMGVPSAFERAGFREVARRGGRPIVRRTLRPGRGS